MLVLEHQRALLHCQKSASAESSPPHPTPGADERVWLLQGAGWFSATLKRSGLRTQYKEAHTSAQKLAVSCRAQ